MALSVPRANGDVLGKNGEAKIVIEMAKALAHAAHEGPSHGGTLEDHRWGKRD
jgi:hypothetical protein